jgi:hypothetical protein
MAEKDRVSDEDEVALEKRIEANRHQSWDLPGGDPDAAFYHDEPEFVTTRHEVFQLAKHWAMSDLESRWGAAFTKCLDSGDVVIREAAATRLNYIKCSFGEAFVGAAVEQVRLEWEQKHGSRLWRRFCDEEKSERLAGLYAVTKQIHYFHNGRTGGDIH